MNFKEQKELHRTIDDLIMKSNGWEQIDAFFKRDLRLKPYLEDARKEMSECGNSGLATQYVLAIENLLDSLT